MLAGRLQTKFKKLFQNQEYIQTLIGLRNVSSKKSEVLKVIKLYSGEKRKEYVHKQNAICIGVVNTKK